MKWMYVVVVLFILGVMVFEIKSFNNKAEYQITVTDKEVKTQYKGGSKYLVFTELDNKDIRVFEVEDSLLAGRFNSSDVYAKLKVGSSYKIKTRGFRIPFLSEYENIMEIK